jgi:hypothetical protein
MASETYIFLILILKLKFSTDFENLECIRSVFLSSFFKNPNGGVIFEKKSTFLQKDPSHPKLNFYQILKKQSCRPKTQDIQKKSNNQMNPSEESSDEECPVSRDFFRAKNYPAKNSPCAEYS